MGTEETIVRVDSLRLPSKVAQEQATLVGELRLFRALFDSPSTTEAESIRQVNNIRDANKALYDALR